MEKSFESQVRHALENASGWASIDDLVSLVGEHVAVPEDFASRAVQDRVKGVIRRQLKQMKDADGLSQWESIERPAEDGTTEKVYKQLALFEKADFRVSIDNYAERGSYYIRKANTLAERCNKTYKTRLQLPFPSFGTLSDEEARVA